MPVSKPTIKTMTPRTIMTPSDLAEWFQSLPISLDRYLDGGFPETASAADMPSSSSISTCRSARLITLPEALAS
ncbi:hypothetical protein AB0C40_35285 [Streptomyces brevispora]|uniref:hypothetical protein n=1 Tax=Streptomyces brevispora TaxID=887462 RepID=UPI003402B284